jgi:hypothetical protein
MLMALRFVVLVNCGQAKDGGVSSLVRALAFAEEGVWVLGRLVWRSEVEVVGGSAVSRFRVS